MLQEIINKIKAPAFGFFDRLKSLLYGSTIGLLKDYQNKTLELIRITAATYYLQGMKALREVAMLLAGVLFAVVVLSIAIVVTPIAVIMVSTLSAPIKACLILAVGLAVAGAALLALSNIFSEKRWLELTKANEMVEKILNEKF